MRQDDALRRAGRAGGVGDRGDDCGPGARGPGVRRGPPSTQAGRLQRQVRVDHHGTHVRERRGLARDVGARGVRDQRRPRARDGPAGRSPRPSRASRSAPRRRRAPTARRGSPTIAGSLPAITPTACPAPTPWRTSHARELVARLGQLAEGDRSAAEREPARARRAAPPAAAGRRARSAEAGRRPRWMREP